MYGLFLLWSGTKNEVTQLVNPVQDMMKACFCLHLVNVCVLAYCVEVIQIHIDCVHPRMLCVSVGLCV